MSKSSLRCQKVRNGETTQIITPKSTLILVIVAAAVTSISRTDLKKIGKPNSGHNGQNTPRSP